MAGVITFGKPNTGEHEHKGGLFKHDTPLPAIDYSEDITNLRRRLRILEEKNTSLQNRMETVEQNMISRHKQVLDEVKTIISDINELKKENNELKERMLMLIKELQMSAKKEELNILKKYLDMWEPVNFVTHHEVEELVDEAISRRIRSASK
ncbi:MAG: hypothetical protein ABIJ08_03150 [Nanoarchaeota archaeon]